MSGRAQRLTRSARLDALMSRLEARGEVGVLGPRYEALVAAYLTANCPSIALELSPGRVLEMVHESKSRPVSAGGVNP